LRRGSGWGWGQEKVGCARSGEGGWQFGAGVGEKLAPFQRIRQCGVSEKGE